MKTDKNLKEFIENLRKTSPEIPADTVKSLIGSGKSSPFVAKRSFQPRRIKQMFNPLKILIMITPIVIITSALLIFNSGNRKESLIPSVSKIDQGQVNTEVVSKPEQANQSIFQYQTEKPKLNEQTLKDGASQKESSDSYVSPNLPNGIAPQGKSDTIREPLNILSFDKNVFKCLGFYFDHGEYIFFSKIGKDWFRCGWPVPAGDLSHPAKEEFQSVMKGFLPYELGFTGKSVPILAMQHNYSKFDLALTYEIWQKDSVDGMLFNEALQLCLPIRINDPSLSKKTQHDIFWIYPNESFFECLPPDIAKPIKEEFYNKRKQFEKNPVPAVSTNTGVGNKPVSNESLKISNEFGSKEVNLKKDTNTIKTEQVPCVYFKDLCESLPGLDYINLYPNPVSEKLNVDLVILKAKKISFRVFDIGGRMLVNESSPEDYPNGGQFIHQVDVSKLHSGLYLLVMSDEEGAKLTRRFVKN